MSWAVWITGVPAGEKSVIARAAVEAIAAEGRAVELLDLDEMRRLVTPRPTDTAVERNLVYRALVYVASRLVDAGVPVVIDATAPRRAWRDLARSMLPRFAEIELTSGLELGRNGEHAPEMAYERSTCPDLVFDTTRVTAAAAAGQIAELVKEWPQTRRSSAGAQWAVWITGLPGSGKTTIASNVADTLIQQGVDVRILELADLRSFVTAGLWSSLAEDVAHRALVYVAKRLSAIGTPVIVDATAPVRAWRQLARQSIARFAEVQLVCPASVCANRERAVRWGLLGCPHRRTTTAAADGPDIVLAYEHALSPELVIHTDVEDLWSAVHRVLELALRMQRAEGAQVA